MPRAFEGAEGQWYSQQEVDSAAAAARREGKTAGANEAKDDYEGLTPKEVRALISERDGLKTQLETEKQATATAKAEADQLKADQAARDSAEKIKAALKDAGFKPERLDALLKFVPEGADLADAEKAKPVIEQLKKDYPEWVTPDKPGAGGKPTGSAATASASTVAAPAGSNGVPRSPSEGGSQQQASSLRGALTDFVSPKS
jgi:hypothetical protein